MAVQKFTIVEGTQNAHILALSDKYFLHLEIDVLQFGSFFLDHADFIAFQGDLGVIEGKTAGNLVDVEFQFLEGNTLVLFLLVCSNGIPAFLIFFKGENNDKNNFMFFIFFLMQNMFDGIFGVKLVEINNESLFELYIFGIIVEL